MTNTIHFLHFLIKTLQIFLHKSKTKNFYTNSNALTMNNNPSQNNPTSNNTHGLNFNSSTNGLINCPNTLPPTTSQNTHSSTMNNTFLAHPPTDNNAYHHTQPMPDNSSTSQYSQPIDQTPLRNAFSTINSLNITISSPQTYFIFVPMSSSDMQNQPQQGDSHFPSQTQFQQ